jgi:hypothetical protein
MTAPVARLYLSAAFAVAAPAAALATPSVTVASTAGAITLGLDGRGTASTHIVKVADLSLSTDSPNGLTASISSGTLTSPGGVPVAFQVALVDDNAPAPLASAFTTGSGTLCLFATGGAVVVAKDLYIKYTPAALQDPGAYAGSIDIDVVDN